MSLANASWLEILYTAIVGIGAIFSAWCLLEAIKDRRAVVRRRRTIEDIYAEQTRSNIRAESVRLGVLLTFFCAGLVAMRKAPDTVIPDELTVLVRLAFLVATVGLSLNSWSAYRHRRSVAQFNREQLKP